MREGHADFDENFAWSNDSLTPDRCKSVDVRRAESWCRDGWGRLSFCHSSRLEVVSRMRMSVSPARPLRLRIGVAFLSSEPSRSDRRQYQGVIPPRNRSAFVQARVAETRTLGWLYPPARSNFR